MHAAELRYFVFEVCAVGGEVVELQFGEFVDESDEPFETFVALAYGEGHHFFVAGPGGAVAGRVLYQFVNFKLVGGLARHFGTEFNLPVFGGPGVLVEAVAGLEVVQVDWFAYPVGGVFFDQGGPGFYQGGGGHGVGGGEVFGVLAAAGVGQQS